MKKTKAIQKEETFTSINSLVSFSCSDLPTLSTTIREKKLNVFPLLNSAYTSPVNKHKKLQEIRGRKNKANDVTPQVISSIIKQFFIPIFDAQRIRKKNLVTPKSLEFSQSLSEIFEAQLKDSRKTLTSLKARLKEIENDRELKVREVKNLEEKILISKVSIETGTVKTDCLIKDSSCLALNRFLGLYENAKKKKENESKKLNFEKIQNSILDDTANKLDHFHSLFKMQSEIMGESLKGLFFANNQLDSQNTYSVFQSNINLIQTRSKSLQNFELKSSEKIQILTINIQKTSDQSLAKLDERASYQKDSRNWLLKYNYEKDLFSSEYRKSYDEKEIKISKFFDLQKKSSVLEDEFGKMQKKLKEINSKNKLSDYEEKICKFCRQYFIEKDNYNWSCCVHPSEFSENQFYYCCGADFKEAPGCRKSKHSSNTSENKVIQFSKDSKLTCLSCGGAGHLFRDCEKDPNPKNSSQLIYKPVKSKNKLKIKVVSKIKEEEERSEFSDIELDRKLLDNFH